MTRDPGSKWWPLPEAGAPDGHTKTQFIVHSTGDNASADRIRGYFAQQGVVVESTFIVGMTSDDPTLQIMDSTDRADANGSANVRAISVETVGDGTGPFTNWQVSEIIRLGIWAAANHPIERRICPAHDQSGFGWHIMFGSPGPWTTRRKICPGPVRIQQLKDIIFPAIFAGNEENDDMAKADQDAINAYVNQRINDLAGRVTTQVKAIMEQVDQRVDDLANHVTNAVAELKAVLPCVEPDAPKTAKKG